jgi:hypothetical protein
LFLFSTYLLCNLIMLPEKTKMLNLFNFSILINNIYLDFIGL